MAASAEDLAAHDPLVEIPEDEQMPCDIDHHERRAGDISRPKMCIKRLSESAIRDGIVPRADSPAANGGGFMGATRVRYR
jgi:hypothetical protein